MKKQHGFTLMELMITVALVAILTAIAVPSYQNYTQNSYRANTKSDLQDAANRAERFKAMRFTYTNINSGGLVPATSPFAGGTPRYNVTITAINSGAGYELKAASLPAFHPTKKEVMKLRSDGQRCISALAAASTDCTYGTDPSW